MTKLSFRVEQSLKEDVNLLAEYLTRRVESKSSAGAVARTLIASGLEPEIRVRESDPVPSKRLPPQSLPALSRGTIQSFRS